MPKCIDYMSAAAEDTNQLGLGVQIETSPDAQGADIRASSHRLVSENHQSLIKYAQVSALKKIGFIRKAPGLNFKSKRSIFIEKNGKVRNPCCDL